MLSPAMGELSFIPLLLGSGNLVRRDNVQMGRVAPGIPRNCPSPTMPTRQPGLARPLFRTVPFLLCEAGKRPRTLFKDPHTDKQLNPCSMKGQKQGPPRLPAPSLRPIHANKNLFTVWSASPAIIPWLPLPGAQQPRVLRRGAAAPSLGGMGGVGAGSRALGLL